MKMANKKQIVFDKNTFIILKYERLKNKSARNLNSFDDIGDVCDSILVYFNVFVNFLDFFLRCWIHWIRYISTAPKRRR